MATGRVPTTANSPLTAKGDLFTYSTAPARLAVGNNGESLVADSSTSTGLRYQGSIAAGKNFLINGGFDIWQRGTSFSVSAFNFPYTADRWTTFNGNACTISQETTTIPTGANFAIKVTGGATTSGYELYQGVESVNAIRLAGKTVTASILATGTTGVTHTLTVEFSTSVDPNAATGSWTGIAPAGQATVTSGTFSQIKSTVAIPSNAKSIRIKITTGSLTSGQTAIFGNAQLELGSVPTEFSRAGGTIQGELAACQRYFQILGNGASFQPLGIGAYYATTDVYVTYPFKTTMRTAPTYTYSGGNTGASVYVAGVGRTSTSTGIGTSSTNVAELIISTAADTIGRAGICYINASQTLSFSSEL